MSSGHGVPKPRRENEPNRQVHRGRFYGGDDDVSNEDGPSNDDWIHQAYWNQAQPKPDNSYYDGGRLRDDTKPRYGQ